VADWATISALATAGGTLVLAGATFASVRSGNRAARVAERSLLAGLRPLLLPSRPEDPPQKVNFVDGKWIMTPGGGAGAEATDAAVYLTLALRNVGTGIAVLHGWRFYPGIVREGDPREDVDSFRRLVRDLYVPSGDVGFWQGAFRDATTTEFAQAHEVVEARGDWTLDVLYGDHEGGQRTIVRFAVFPRQGGDGWYATAGRYWNIDRDDPR
jgi:hypothetical protein